MGERAAGFAGAPVMAGSAARETIGEEVIPGEWTPAAAPPQERGGEAADALREGGGGCANSRMADSRGKVELLADGGHVGIVKLQLTIGVHADAAAEERQVIRLMSLVSHAINLPCEPMVALCELP